MDDYCICRVQGRTMESSHWYGISIENLTGQIMVSGQMTIHDRYHIRSALLTGSLSESEQILINRLLYGVRHGLLSVID